MVSLKNFSVNSKFVFMPEYSTLNNSRILILVPVLKSGTLCCLVWCWCEEIFSKYFSTITLISHFSMVISKYIDAKSFRSKAPCSVKIFSKRLSLSSLISGTQLNSAFCRLLVSSFEVRKPPFARNFDKEMSCL